VGIETVLAMHPDIWNHISPWGWLGGKKNDEGDARLRGKNEKCGVGPEAEIRRLR